MNSEEKHKNDKVKVIAFYLPQFHSIPENDCWWGKDFTEWMNVKNAKPLFDGHVQPKVPLSNNYYNLLNDDTKLWQTKLAKEYGVYGFCYYHYWFEGKMLLQKPMEQMLKNKIIDLPFCICWANASWTKEWIGKPKDVLIQQTYGKKDDWERHYDYLKPFFKDNRYIKKDGKPLFVIYNPTAITNCVDMLNYWNERAKSDGFLGICFVSQMPSIFDDKTHLSDSFDYHIEFQPTCALKEIDKKRLPFLRGIKRFIVKHFNWFFQKTFKKDLDAINFQKEVRKIDYDTAWKTILRLKPLSDKSIPGAFCKWDNTPRKGNKGIVYTGNTPEKFKEYFKKQVFNCKKKYHQDFLFIYAWNEWAEGGYLEPDEETGFSYLEAIKDALDGNIKKCDLNEHGELQ